MSSRPKKGKKSEDQEESAGVRSAESRSISDRVITAKANENNQNLSLSNLSLEESDQEGEEFVKSIQRQAEMNKRELKYELLLDLRSKISK